MLSDSIAAHLHMALTEAIRDERAVGYDPAALVDARGVGRLSIWDVAEIAAEAAEMHQAETFVYCEWCGTKHMKGQGSWPMTGCPSEETA
jgi:NADH pyrophosphatase NudC (nudix superfamily)